jgi:hypothetical protein
MLPVLGLQASTVHGLPSSVETYVCVIPLASLQLSMVHAFESLIANAASGTQLALALHASFGPSHVRLFEHGSPTMLGYVTLIVALRPAVQRSRVQTLLSLQKLSATLHGNSTVETGEALFAVLPLTPLPS